MAARVADRADSVSAVVMDPYTGAILAEASYPSYDANNYSAVAADDPGALRRPCGVGRLRARLGLQAADGRSPALETGTRPSTPVQRHGHPEARRWQDAGPRRGPEAHGHPRPPRTASRARGTSSRPGSRSASANAPWRVRDPPRGLDTSRLRGADRHRCGRRGRRTGARPGDRRRGAQIDLANGAFGQGVAVTPIQLATAYAAMVNGGILVQPHVVAADRRQAASWSSDRRPGPRSEPSPRSSIAS